ncbi:MAG: hypothetical protein CGU28_10125 [Candidatus Dactylopiibacterium carminicum]|uniref:ROK family transcriptional regulator n=1 Tax=Candidatus Dactylopiibacterium carminicum TaxID=857335 RepID=A0A272ESG2_9RHOO|nr:ROK family transcriptional regulator [Candidatus Dactylopiibacterium carminicum]KAF7598738.1 ROK family transcriptional regulator [Candidatus Dactylopiibacterium carminicum]PAS92650.1 MAG: hypothetical protein CGU29_10865 [Candidatus Dactylopiibacterium carminicum]PAS96140.1 MAG: hypothetical protein CGU28_10125 [Candidatus Dactylopiibacterium carminicum]PAS98758.1 MAG: hypothetical protein BSR46_11795 [Candidatus Dactylopiibacterium carminicum]
MVISGNQRFIRNVNRIAILRALRDASGLSRADLADLTGLTRSAIGRLVDGLIAEGWVAEDKSVPSGALGRRPTPLRLDTQRLLVLGTDFNSERIHVAACSIDGNLRAFEEESVRGLDGHSVLKRLARLVERVTHPYMMRGFQFRGMGVAAPGTVDGPKGVLLQSDSTGWHDLPVICLLREQLSEPWLTGIPLLVERAVCCVAMQFVHTGKRPLTDSLVYVHLGQKLACAAVVDGVLVKGAHGLAGRVGHQQLLPDGPMCACGQRGCANATLSLQAMQMELGVDGAAALQARLALRDEAASAVLNRAADLLARFLHNLGQVYGMDRLLLGGPVVELGNDFLTRVAIQLGVFAGQPPKPLQLAPRPVHAAAQGAASLMLRHLLDVEAESPRVS